MRTSTRNRSLALLGATATVLALSACSGGTSGGGGGSLDDMEPITLTWAEFGPEGTGTANGVQAWMDYIEEESDGKVTFETYWASSLFGGSEALAQTGAGVADVSTFSSSFNPDDIPVANYLLEAGVAADASYPIGYLESTAATNEFYTSNEDLIAELEGQNVFAIGARSTPRYGLLCTDEVSTPGDAEGKRTRVGGGAWVAEAEALGMATQFTPVPEIYEAVQRGVLDCIVLPPSAFADLSYWEVAKHFVPTAFSPFPGSMTIVNLDTWNSFPDELKQIFLDGSAKAVSVTAEGDLGKLADFITRGEAEYDIQFYDPAALDAVITGVQDDVLANFADDGPAGVADPDAFLAEYQEDIAKWHDFFLEKGFTSGADQTVTNNAAAAADDDSWQEALEQAILDSVKGRFAE